MGWLAFTAIDLYLGLLLIDMIARNESLTADKQRRLQVAKKATIGLLFLNAIAFLITLAARKWM